MNDTRQMRVPRLSLTTPGRGLFVCLACFWPLVPAAQVEVERHAPEVELQPDTRNVGPSAVPLPTAEEVSVDERSVWYHLHRGDLDMMRLEIDRLRLEHPGWQPQGDLAHAIEDRLRAAVEASRAATQSVEPAAGRAAEPDAPATRPAVDVCEQPQRVWSLPLASSRRQAALLDMLMRCRDGGVLAGTLGRYFEPYDAVTRLDEAERLLNRSTWSRRSQILLQDARYRFALERLSDHDKPSLLSDRQVLWLTNEVVRRQDGGAAITLGWNALAHEDERSALEWFGRGAEWRHGVSARTGLASAYALQARKALLLSGDLDAGLESLQASRRAGGDPAEALAWGLYEQERWGLSRRLFSEVSDPEVAAYGTALALRAEGDDGGAIGRACAESARSKRLNDLCAILLESRVLAAWNSQDLAGTLAWGQRLESHTALPPGVDALLAWASLRSGKPQDAAERFEQLLGRGMDAEISSGLMDSLHQSGQSKRLERLAAVHPELAVALKEQRRSLAWARGQFDLHERLTPQQQRLGREHWAVTSGYSRASARGEAGLDRARFGQTQLGLSGLVGTLRVEMGWRGTRLDAGRAGSNAALGLRLPNGGGTVEASRPISSADFDEFVLQARIEQPDYTLEAGVGTGLHRALVGTDAVYRLAGTLYRKQVSVHTSLSRQPRTDSLVALGGARDPVDGEVWGGVSETRLRVQPYWALGTDRGVSMNLEHGWLRGVKVPDNRRSKLRVDFTHAFKAPHWAHLRAGPFVSVERYRRNLSKYTLGHGGYFSPQRDFRVGGQFDVLSAEGGPWLLHVQGSVAYVDILERSAKRFQGQDLPGQEYSSSRTRGIAGDVRARAGRLLGPNALLSGSIGVASAPGYDYWTVGIMLNVSLGTRRGMVRQDLSTVFERFAD